jgi:beta-phosphoglucomutase
MAGSDNVNPRGVIFDMDGVIVDSGPAHLASWQTLAAEHGMQITREQFAKSFGIPAREIIRMRWGPDLTDEQVRQLDERKEEIYRERVRGRLPVIPGAVELIQALHEKGWRLGIGSSGPPENVKLVVEGLGLAAYLSATTSARDVTCGKPDPQVFLIVADRMGVPPARCVVVEDAVHGIIAARRARMKAVAITTTHPAESFDMADLVISSMTQLSPETLERLLDDQR